MSEKSALYREVFKSFFQAFKRLSLYSSQHPLSRETLTNAFSIVDMILREKKEIVFSADDQRGLVLLNDEPMGMDVLGVREICRRFRGLGLGGVVFTQGLVLNELADFIKALAWPSSPDGKASEAPDIFRVGSQHIEIRKVLVEYAQEQVAAGLGVETDGGRPEKIIVDVRDFLSGKAPDAGCAPEAVFEKLEGDPGRLAEVAVQVAREAGDFDGVLKKWTAWMIEHVVPFVLERKPGSFVVFERFFDALRAWDMGVVFPSAEDAIYSCADDIKMAMVLRAFFSFERDPGKAVALAAEILGEERGQEKYVSRLAGDLAARPGGEDFIRQLKAEMARDDETAVSQKKLRRLMRISERFDEELEARVKTATEELTRLNKRLADEKERTDAIVRHVAEGVVVVNKEGRILMMNPAAEKLLDSQAKESLGKYLVQSLKDHHLLAVAKDLDHDKGAALTKEIKLDSKDETTKKVLRASTAVVENENGDTVGMVSVLSDITHEKQIEEIKSQFVSLVTHELRTPVVAIQKSLELIDSGVTGAVNEDQKRFLEISKLNLARLNSLINDLLDMSKLEAGRLVLLPSSFDIRGVIQEVKTSLSSWIRDKEITVRQDVPEVPVMVNADKDRMVQVMVNLVGNALKFTPKKGEVNISLKALDRKDKICEEPCAQIAVSDSGIGVDPKDFKRIFNKFEQVSLVSPVGTGGTGLGLSIAKEIINLHGGDIWVESQVGHGSTFTFVIPRAFHGGKNSAE